jgi:hypothetical protein
MVLLIDGKEQNTESQWLMPVILANQEAEIRRSG